MQPVYLSKMPQVARHDTLIVAGCLTGACYNNKEGMSNNDSAAH
jgi:hypothetical protein